MKLLYAFPAFLYCAFVALIGFDVGFGSFQIEAWVYVALLIAAAVLLCRNKWWGCIPGMAVGGIIVYLFETSHVHQHVNVTPLGIGVAVYFAAMGILCYKLAKLK